jgi:uncharacterized MAPEG superfamily protein
MASIPFNFPLLTIPIYYALSLFPHAYAATRMTQKLDNFKSFDNTNSKGTAFQAKLKRQLTDRDLAAYERGEACHRNNNENMPLLVAAVFAGLLAEQRAGDGEVGLTKFCVAWLVLRLLYTINYMFAETQQLSYVRTLLYNVGTIYAFWIIGRASWVLGH